MKMPRRRFARPLPPSAARSGFIVVGRSASLSSQIVADVREALFDKRLKPGDFLGTEKDLAARHGVSRIVARDALRTLEALGIVEIRMGKGGGARVARGNPRLFAEALAVQLDLTGVSAAEILDAQRAVECMAAELAAEHATPADHARLQAAARRRREQARRHRRLHAVEPRIPSRHRRGLAQPRAGGAVHLAPERVVAVAQPDAHPEGGAPRPRRAQGARRPDRDARCAPARAG